MKDITGKKYGRLTVVRPAFKDGRGEWHWECLCDCGNYKTVTGNKLRSGNTQSCGCLQKESRGTGRITHHMTNSRIYTIWLNMKARCFNPKAASYPNYGARGITVCDEWRNSFEEFHRWAEDSGYSDGLSLERKDVNGNYEPSNCSWITPYEQHLNRTDSHKLSAFGETHTIQEWAEKTGLKYDTIERRVNQYGWSIEDALSIKPWGKK